MRKLFITQRNGNKVEVTDLDAAISQAKGAVRFHESKEAHRKETGEGIIYPESHKDWKHDLGELEKLKEALTNWELLGDTPTNEDEEIDEDVTFIRSSKPEPFNEETFVKGTDIYTIWHWFEETYNVSVAKDLMNQ